MPSSNFEKISTFKDRYNAKTAEILPFFGIGTKQTVSYTRTPEGPTLTKFRKMTKIIKANFYVALASSLISMSPDLIQAVQDPPQFRDPVVQPSKSIDLSPNNAGESSNLTESSNNPVDVTNTASQSWKTYDISPYTTTVKSTQNPEQNILDWILRETGTDVWFGEPMGVLSVGRHSIRCYHTPEIQQKVSGIVDRFIKTKDMDEVFGLQVITVDNPNWRAKSLRLLTRFETKSPGVEGWLTTKENAAQLFNELRKRSDFSMPIAPTLISESGQPKQVIQLQPLNYFRSIIFDNRSYPAFRVETARIDEGFSIKLSALRSKDGKLMDAELVCSVDQVEQFRNVNVDVPGPNGSAQTHPISVPQLSSWRLKERFRWPTDRVLILSVGVVAAPNRKMQPSLNLTNVFEPNRRRADALLFLDSKGIYKRGQTPRSANGLTPVPQRR